MSVSITSLASFLYCFPRTSSLATAYMPRGRPIRTFSRWRPTLSRPESGSPLTTNPGPSRAIRLSTCCTWSVSMYPTSRYSTTSGLPLCPGSPLRSTNRKRRWTAWMHSSSVPPAPLVDCASSAHQPPPLPPRSSRSIPR
ncbi:hypothetical protein FB45DRAFT_887056 [Roridomyces roridus]|uniref:Uncharacterized protein n=1 Tax=Roridomyces roridus TaxID=1738132 RepID=A0AAD7CIS9_9AGAR|nr:hypothetical protein FB45DRAFT_887056 [Roridomyces roridus]